MVLSSQDRLLKLAKCVPGSVMLLNLTGLPFIFAQGATKIIAWYHRLA